MSSEQDGEACTATWWLQVADALTPAHCLRALQRLADEAGPAALPHEQLAAALRLARSVHELQAQGHSFHGQACSWCPNLSKLKCSVAIDPRGKLAVVTSLLLTTACRHSKL